jgi:hypothetical protein
MSEKNERQREVMEGHYDEPSDEQMAIAASERRRVRLGLPDRAPLFVIEKPEQAGQEFSQELRRGA